VSEVKWGEEAVYVGEERVAGWETVYAEKVTCM
jgi:hypothetical protein